MLKTVGPADADKIAILAQHPKILETAAIYACRFSYICAEMGKCAQR